MHRQHDSMIEHGDVAYLWQFVTLDTVMSVKVRAHLHDTRLTDQDVIQE